MDGVPLNRVANVGFGEFWETDPSACVERNVVPSTRRCAADGVVCVDGCATAGDGDPCDGVGDARGARGICADEIALNGVVR